MSKSFLIRLAKEQFTFCAAHFITYNRDVCEPLHGHNYRVSVEIKGPCDENHYVVDFIAARDLLAALTQKLDHQVLLPTEHPRIQVRCDGQEVTAKFGQRRWVFPTSDCVLLPVANTTAERIAEYLGEMYLGELREQKGFVPLSLELVVDECEGQQGVFQWEPASTP